LADDFRAVLDAIASLLGEEFAIVGMLNSGGAVMEQAVELRPDVIVLDISLGDMTGFEVARALKKLGVPAKIVFLTVHEEPEFIRAAEDGGASGYVFKSQVYSELREAITAAGRGDRHFPKALRC
jgi:DNA-binding NarL/FixJ family response regulator